MQFNLVFLATALLASASVAMSATITGFAGPDCTGSLSNPLSIQPGECVSLGGDFVSISYSGVPSKIGVFLGDSCDNGADPFHLGPSGCVTAPAGFHWGCVFVV
ncbi:hypothetical protein BDN70DRAFT_888392 [Pholiota conissans]|uniref:Uncharacterized protein n=1 Tax=Pholiota conissans TaxID=109636 RepID=A0A9P5YMC7_9AGAR|nr:hypothetical protein BDN70DRAFT_888392 [Pholiota conissans]